MKYVVKIDYKQFVFSEGTDALNFAEVAKESTADKTVKVVIELEDEEA